jgi:hypothetical protein
MATAASVAKRRGEAEMAIKAAVSAIAAKHGVEVSMDAAYNVRDIELRRVMDMEMTAANLTAISEKIGGKKAEAKAEPKEEAAEEVAETPKAAKKTKK